MSLKDLIDPEAMIQRMIERMGVKPADVVALAHALGQSAVLIREVHAELVLIKAEREAFKIGAAGVVAEFRAALARLEVKIEEPTTGVNGHERYESGPFENGAG